MSLSVPSFERCRVLVVGDVMLDAYWHGETSRISPEAPVPVVHVRAREHRPGGAANVAVNVAALGARPLLLGTIGDDAAGETLARLLDGLGVEHALATAAGRATVAKTRIVSRHQQLLRLDVEDGFEPMPAPAWADTVAERIARADAVVISDYGKGTVADPGAIIDAARAAGRPVLVDPKGDDFGRYRGATAITPNLRELELVVGRARDLDDLLARAEGLRASLGLDALLVTRGEDGMTLLRAGTEPVHQPARAREVYDVTGAGDTVIGVLAAALGAGETMTTAMALANLAAGIVVGRLGTAAVGRGELERAAREHAPLARGVVDEAGLLASLVAARADGERIVMTNGCFDILHAGHVSCLERARALGDRLVVAVNDDASVRRLKGPGRPLNPAARRMAVLAALSAVDWVVPFADDTPEALVRAVRPDVLVKGADYAADAVAGGAWLREHGGRVELLPLEEGCSTSAIIDAVRGLDAGAEKAR